MKTHRFVATEINELQRILELFVTTKQANLTDFLKFVAEHDRRRQTSFIKTFPEMQELVTDHYVSSADIEISKCIK
jgi:hypothetical protein